MILKFIERFFFSREHIFLWQGWKDTFLAFCLFMLFLGLWGCSETEMALHPIDGKVTLSGAVLDTNGERVSDLFVYLQYMLIDSYGWQRRLATSSFETQTDENGRFTFSDVDPGVVGFRLIPLSIPDELTKYDLISVQIGENAYPLVMPSYSEDAVFFSVPADTRIEDIEIRVQAKMRIRVKVVFENGMPLANYPLIVSRQYEASHGGTYGSQREFRTDIDGYLTCYVSVGGYYRIGVTYRGVSGQTGRFLVRKGEDRDDLQITFDSPPLPRYQNAE